MAANTSLPLRRKPGGTAFHRRIIWPFSRRNGRLRACIVSRPSPCGGVAALFLPSPPARPRVTNLFGFTGTEIYPIDQQINLHVADLDGDGLNDLIVVEQSALQNQPALQSHRQDQPPDAAPAQKPEVNDLPPDSRFRIDSMPTEERIAALAVADVNGDGRPDLVYFGDGKDLMVRYNLGTNGWSEPKRWHIDDGRLDPNALAVGRFERRRTQRHCACSATTARFIFSRSSRTTRWPSR